MTNTKAMTDEQIDIHLDAILKASGSALKHYSMQKRLDDMRSALRAALSDPMTTDNAKLIDALTKIASLTQTNQLLWWQKLARQALSDYHAQSKEQS